MMISISIHVLCVFSPRAATPLRFCDYIPLLVKRLVAMADSFGVAWGIVSALQEDKVVDAILASTMAFLAFLLSLFECIRRRVDAAYHQSLDAVIGFIKWRSNIIQPQNQTYSSYAQLAIEVEREISAVSSQILSPSFSSIVILRIR